MAQFGDVVWEENFFPCGKKGRKTSKLREAKEASNPLQPGSQASREEGSFCLKVTGLLFYEKRTR